MLINNKHLLEPEVVSELKPKNLTIYNILICNTLKQQNPCKHYKMSTCVIGGKSGPGLTRREKLTQAVQISDRAG